LNRYAKHRKQENVPSHTIPKNFSDSLREHWAVWQRWDCLQQDRSAKETLHTVQDDPVFSCKTRTSRFSLPKPLGMLNQTETFKHPPTKIIIKNLLAQQFLLCT
jgi:hypothetical protein